MGNVKQINTENRTYYFFNDMINIKDFDWNLLKIAKTSYKNIGIYNIGYITVKKIDDYEVEKSIEIKNGSKYLVFNSTELHSADENKEVWKKIQRALGWD